MCGGAVNDTIPIQNIYVRSCFSSVEEKCELNSNRFSLYFIVHWISNRISNGNAKNKAIWIDGGIHAREWISPASVTYIVNDLVENWDEQPQHIRNINWYILPVHNPDGYEYTHRTGKCHKVSHSTDGVFYIEFNEFSYHKQIDCGERIVLVRADAWVLIWIETTAINGVAKEHRRAHAATFIRDVVDSVSPKRLPLSNSLRIAMRNSMVS